MISIKEILTHQVINPLYRLVSAKEKCVRYKSNRKYFLYLFYRLIYNHYQIKYSVQIPASVKIGHNFSIGHWGGIVVNVDTTIGNHVHIMNGVLIGSEVRGSRKGAPVIGDRVWIGTNSCIVGNVRIGNDVLIVANSFVNFDVPDHSIVIGNPAKVIHKEDATLEYI